MKKPRLALTALLSLAPALALGAEFHYQQQGDETLYVAQSESPEVIFRLTGIDFTHLRRIADLSQPKEVTALSNINTDTSSCSTTFSGVPAICDYQHAWLSDGRQILWAGKKVIGADVASFRAYGKFAADKDSLYFDGQRTDDNRGEKQVDMATLAATDVDNMLKDKRNLYYQGRWLGNADGFDILGWKSWSRESREANPLRTRWGVDFIVLTTQQVIVNGVAITADPASFGVIRWLPGSLLIYRDKNGEHHYTIDNEERDCSQNFDIQSRQVTWRRRTATKYGNCQVETLPGVDPEQFNVISSAIAQYQDRIYIVEDRDLLDQRLKVISVTGLDPSIELHIGINPAGKDRAYIVRDGGIQTVKTVGKMIRIKNSDGDFSTLFSHDERYVYAFLEGQMWRYKTARPESASINNEGDLVTDEGIYRYGGDEIKFFPHCPSGKKQCDTVHYRLR